MYLLCNAMAYIVIFSHHNRKTTKTGRMSLDQAKTVVLLCCILYIVTMHGAVRVILSNYSIFRYQLLYLVHHTCPPTIFVKVLDDLILRCTVMYEPVLYASALVTMVAFIYSHQLCSIMLMHFY